MLSCLLLTMMEVVYAMVVARLPMSMIHPHMHA